LRGEWGVWFTEKLRKERTMERLGWSVLAATERGMRGRWTCSGEGRVSRDWEREDLVRGELVRGCYWGYLGMAEREEEEQAAGWVGGCWLGSDGFRFRVSCLSPCLILKLPHFLCVL